MKKFVLEHGKPKRTHAATHAKLSKDEDGKDVDSSLYGSMICSLFISLLAGLIMHFFVGVCTRYQANIKASHLSFVKRIDKYIHGNADYGIVYSHDTNSSLVSYSDVDWARNIDDRESTSGGCFFLGNNLIS